ncbi:serine/arginine repetitive matrix protein 1 [Zea mays]|uniref:serine/arginine repetitive matrix protein 1 n=1 Tax=Zea mays TaxID=4577 RepID=UPI000C6C3A9B|nr:serine/arginine repetitive matrix protein 1 [Zea mays]|eukprot:XP_023155927.1 serine/arginine repetitive matrix protein 1 [Zea mays]
MEQLAPHWQGGLPSMRAPRSRGAAPEEDRRGRAAGHAPRRDARVLGPDRARPCAGSEAEAAPLPGGPPRSQPWSRARGGTPRPGGRYGNAVVPAAADEWKAEKAKKQDSVDAAASDVGSCVSLSLATDERSEAASESSVATSSVAGPERSPRTKPARRRPASADLGSARRERDRDRAVAASYGVRSRSARASASPPPRQVPRDRSVRHSPSPAAKRRALSEPRRATSPTPSVQRKPSVPARPASRVWLPSFDF